MDKIYVVHGTEQTGPFTESDIRAQLASGAITGETMVWWEGLPEWLPLSQTPLGQAAGAIAPTAPGAPMVAAAATKTSSLALTSMITGIVGFPALICWPIALILNIVAIVTGHMARGEIKKNPAVGGKGMALAGLICGYIGILFVVAVIAISVLIALGNQVKGVFTTITSQLSVESGSTNQ